jgi:hypothetical protein
MAEDVLRELRKLGFRCVNYSESNGVAEVDVACGNYQFTLWVEKVGDHEVVITH